MQAQSEGVKTETNGVMETLKSWVQSTFQNVTDMLTSTQGQLRNSEEEIGSKVSDALEIFEATETSTLNTVQEMLKLHEEALTLQKATLSQQSDSLFKDMKETVDKTLQATREDIKQLGQEAQKYLELSASGYGAHEAQLSIASEKVHKQITSLGNELTTSLTEIKTDFDTRYHDDRDIYQNDLKRFKEDYAEKVSDISKRLFEK